MYVSASSKQDTATKKADTSHNLSSNPAGIPSIARERVPDHGEGRRTERDQRHRPSAGRLLFALPLNSNPRPTEQRENAKRNGPPWIRE